MTSNAAQTYRLPSGQFLNTSYVVCPSSVAAQNAAGGTPFVIEAASAASATSAATSPATPLVSSAATSQQQQQQQQQQQSTSKAPSAAERRKNAAVSREAINAAAAAAAAATTAVVTIASGGSSETQPRTLVPVYCELEARGLSAVAEDIAVSGGGAQWRQPIIQHNNQFYQSMAPPNLMLRNVATLNASSAAISVGSKTAPTTAIAASTGVTSSSAAASGGHAAASSPQLFRASANAAATGARQAQIVMVPNGNGQQTLMQIISNSSALAAAPAAGAAPSVKLNGTPIQIAVAPTHNADCPPPPTLSPNGLAAPATRSPKSSTAKKRKEGGRRRSRRANSRQLLLLGAPTLRAETFATLPQSRSTAAATNSKFGPPSRRINDLSASFELADDRPPLIEREAPRDFEERREYFHLFFIVGEFDVAVNISCRFMAPKCRLEICSAIARDNERRQSVTQRTLLAMLKNKARRNSFRVQRDYATRASSVSRESLAFSPCNDKEK